MIAELGKRRGSSVTAQATNYSTSNHKGFHFKLQLACGSSFVYNTSSISVGGWVVTVALPPHQRISLVNESSRKSSNSRACTLSTKLSRARDKVFIACLIELNVFFIRRSCIDSEKWSRSAPASGQVHSSLYLWHSCLITWRQLNTSLKFVTLNFCLM